MRFFFPDNTVLINFSIIARNDLLKSFMGNRGKWTLTISRECSKSSQIPGYEAMSEWHDVLPSPLYPNPSELVDANAIAYGMRKPGDRETSSHMGEAEAFAIIANRKYQAVFLTDDHDAARVARNPDLKISTASTTRILAICQARGLVERDKARGYIAHLLNAGRVLGNPPYIDDYDDYVQRLASLAP